MTNPITRKVKFFDETVSEPLDYDPSEGQDWNWEDYE